MTPKMYPIGIQSFPEIREKGYIYVDKTAYVYKLVAEGKYYFLSRPRRFGKSLLLSTMEAYFSGRKNLFNGLDINKYEKEWNVYPVIHFDFISGKYDSIEDLYLHLDNKLSEYEEKYSISSKSPSFSIRFKTLISAAKKSTGKNVVILVDEYDKPVLSVPEDSILQEKYRTELKAFFSVLKSSDDDIHFSFLIGVTRMGKMSIFSDLNNICDISMERDFSAICGITHTELREYFSESISDMANRLCISNDEMYDKLEKSYDGYRFSLQNEKVFNPFSLLCALRKKEIGDYWFETGTPTFLIKLLKQNNIDLWNFENEEIELNKLSNITSLTSNPLPIIYQTGYLTIKGFDSKYQTVILGFPNEEVRQGFITSLLPLYAGNKFTQTFNSKQLLNDINSGNIDSFMLTLKSLIADIPYAESHNFDYESQYRNILYIIFSILGFHAQAEKHINSGRIDLLIYTSSRIYLFEFKIDSDADIGMHQINDKGYSTALAYKGLPIIKIAVSFSKRDRNIESWKIE